MSADKTGEKFSLFLRELNPAGAAVGGKTVPLTATSAAWVKITASYTALGTGDTIAFYLSASNVPAHSGFRADLLSLTRPATGGGAARVNPAVILLVTPLGGLLGVVAYAARPRPRPRHARSTPRRPLQHH